MKIRTVYFKVLQFDLAVSFWRQFLDILPHKKFDDWVEFRCERLNFAVLRLPEFKVEQDKANCVPVFEFADDVLEAIKTRALSLGARIVVDVADHPDGMSYVLADPSGNEFEITRFHE